ncbi:hypothetical protein [Clavibacter nebraskensis]|uniref:hypothetical protein n=1 Tax=Clavibacter nebraskensis TaxID=31963 RepID=UPI003F4C2A39
MTKARGTNWAAISSRTPSASRDQIQEEDEKLASTEAEAAAAPEAEEPLVVPAMRKAATFRVPFDVLALIELEIQAAKERGERQFKDTTVIEAVRTTYSKKHSAEAVTAMAHRLAAEFAAEEKKKAEKRRGAA